MPAKAGIQSELSILTSHIFTAIVNRVENLHQFVEMGYKRSDILLKNGSDFEGVYIFNAGELGWLAEHIKSHSMRLQKINSRMTESKVFEHG